MVRQTKRRVKYNRFSFVESGEKTLVGSGVNCKIEGGKIYSFGALVPFGKAGEIQVPEEDGVWRFVHTKGAGEEVFLLVSARGSLFVYNPAEENFRLLGEWIFSEPPTVITVFDEAGNELVVFACKSGVFTFNPLNYQTTEVQAEGSVAVCTFHDRIFTAKGYRVRFCAPMEYENWADDADGGGYVDLPSERGEIVGLLRLDDSVAVFAERGIFLLKAGGSARDFSVEEIGYGGGKIYRGSVTESGNYAVFLAEDGAYRFGGKSAKKLFSSSLYGRAERCVACAHEGKGYVAISYGGEEKVVVIDADEENGWLLSGEFANGLSSSGGTLFCASNGKWSSFESTGALPVGAERCFTVNELDFGVHGEKVLKSLKLSGQGSARIAVSGEREGHAYLVRRLEEGATVYPLVKGRSFRLTISPEEDGVIEQVEAELVRFG